MALFGKGDKEKPQKVQADEGLPVVGRRAWCRICDDYRQFTKCWLRRSFVTLCPECGLVFDDPAVLYKKFQPCCPRCGACLEQPGFEYGLCDGCGSRFELVPGTKPGLLPNRKQREDMDKIGKVWRPE